MSNSDCTEVMDTIYEATYSIDGDKVTFNFTNGQKMVMSKKRKNTAE